MSPGDAVDVEAHARGETLYSPDHADRRCTRRRSAKALRACCPTRSGRRWSGPSTSTPTGEADRGRRDARARGPVVAQLDYARRPAADRRGSGGEPTALRAAARGRSAAAGARGRARRRQPAAAEQEVVADGRAFGCATARPVPVEDWNAQISLLTGMAAADIMLHARSASCARCRRPTHGALGMAAPGRATRSASRGPNSQSYAGFVRALDPATRAGAALLELVDSLLRGAGYTAFDGGPPAQPNRQRGRGSVRAHDRSAAAARRPVRGETVRGGLRATSTSRLGFVKLYLRLLRSMADSATQRPTSSSVPCVDLVEAAVLAARVGRRSSGGRRVETMKHGAIVQLHDAAGARSM